jgi:hypothetical protein
VFFFQIFGMGHVPAGWHNMNNKEYEFFFSVAKYFLPFLVDAVPPCLYAVSLVSVVAIS